MNQAIIYHWWGYGSDHPPISNLRSPIMASIATLRGVNKNIPIYVIDISDQDQNWMNYPDKLNFTIHRQKPYLEKRYSHCQGYRHFSRLYDIARFQHSIPENEIIYVDSDVFFLQDPLPLKQTTNKFCFDKYNSGLFYYDKRSDIYQKFQELFEAYATTALNDDSFRYIIQQFGSYDDYFVADETLMYYMYVKYRDLFNVLTTQEHFATRSYENDPNQDLTQVKMYHGNGTMINTGQSTRYLRGLMCLGIKNLYQNIQKSLDVEDIELMFSQQERETYLNLQMDFDNKFLDCMLSTKSETGHYFLEKALD